MGQLTAIVTPLRYFPLDVLANEVKRRNRVLTGDSGESVEFRNLDLHRVVENHGSLAAAN
ncbi:hypothetical protein MZH69_27510 (plasmid) [Escherichia coli]|nr:hypothetical protein MZH69_27480 [Escherichia coli]UTU26877.1 hypothetical protein MZH69_27510 [Escherichia coli]